MAISPEDNIQRWRKWAEESRTAANGLKSDIGRQNLLNVAKSYDEMADKAEMALKAKARPTTR
jgi:hypothetical protein